MARRRHPFLVATRVTASERALIDAVAKIRGETVTALLRGLLLPQIRRLIQTEVATGEARDRPEVEP